MPYRTPPTQPSRLLLTLTTCLLLLSLTTSTGWTQTPAGDGAPLATTCAAPDRCMSRERVLALVDAQCGADRAKAARLPTLLDDIAAVQTQRDVCLGRLAQVQEAPPVPWRSPWWLRVGLDVVPAGLVGGGTACLVGGCGGEVSVGLLVAGGLGVLGRLVLEVIER